MTIVCVYVHMCVYVSTTRKSEELMIFLLLKDLVCLELAVLLVATATSSSSSLAVDGAGSCMYQMQMEESCRGEGGKEREREGFVHALNKLSLVPCKHSTQHVGRVWESKYHLSWLGVVCVCICTCVLCACVRVCAIICECAKC